MTGTSSRWTTPTGTRPSRWAPCPASDRCAPRCRCCAPRTGPASSRLSAHSIQRQNPRIVAYTASKAALSSVTKNLSKSLAKDGILVNCVCPGTIVTASFTENLKDILAADGLDASDPHDVMTWIDNNFHQPCDLGRAGLPEEIASITTYLASKRNGYVTGATVNVDGGSDFV